MKTAKVILNHDVYNLGEEGDVREVAPGYARNFLIPQGLAVTFNKQNLASFEQRKEVIQGRKEEKRFAAKGLKEKIESMVIELEVPAGDTGKLFGSVNSANIAEKLTAEGLTIERKKIDVPDNNIKMIGEYDIRIRLYGDEVAEIKVIVNPVGGKKAVAAEPKAETKPAPPPEDSAEVEAAADPEAATETPEAVVADDVVASEDTTAEAETTEAASAEAETETKADDKTEAKAETEES